MRASSLPLQASPSCNVHWSANGCGTKHGMLATFDTSQVEGVSNGGLFVSNESNVQTLQRSLSFSGVDERE